MIIEYESTNFNYAGTRLLLRVLYLGEECMV